MQIRIGKAGFIGLRLLALVAVVAAFALMAFGPGVQKANAAQGDMCVSGDCDK